MSAWKELLDKKHRGQLVAAVILAVYIISGIPTSADIAPSINTSFGHILIIVVVLAIFTRTNVILGIIIMVAGYELIRRSHPMHTVKKHPVFQPHAYVENFTGCKKASETESKPAKSSSGTETEIVYKKMIEMQPQTKEADAVVLDIVQETISWSPEPESDISSYKPTCEETHDATLLHN